MGGSRSKRFHKFMLLKDDAFCLPGEVLEVFVDMSEDLTLEKEVFKALQVRAGRCANVCIFVVF